MTGNDNPLVTNRFNTTYHALFKLFNRSQNKKVIQNKKLALLKSQEITFHGQSITNFLVKWPYFKATVTQLYIIWLIMTLTEAKAFDSEPDYPGIFQNLKVLI